MTNETLSPRFEAIIPARIEHGDYADAADVVEEALLRMKREDQAELKRLRERCGPNPEICP